MPRHIFTKEERSRGGKNGSTEDKARAGAMGFEATCISHPFFARKYLKRCPGMRQSKQYQLVHTIRPLIARTNTGGKRRALNG